MLNSGCPPKAHTPTKHGLKMNFEYHFNFQTLFFLVKISLEEGYVVCVC